MELINRSDIKHETLPGRIIQKAVGSGSVVQSENMTVGFGRYCAEAGPMEPHNHAEETVVVLDAKKGFVRRGPDKHTMGKRRPLEKGSVLHFDALEWHVFEYDEGGFIDIIFIYGKGGNVRPEEKAAGQN